MVPRIIKPDGDGMVPLIINLTVTVWCHVLLTSTLEASDQLQAEAALRQRQEKFDTTKHNKIGKDWIIWRFVICTPTFQPNISVATSKIKYQDYVVRLQECIYIYVQNHSIRN